MQNILHFKCRIFGSARCLCDLKFLHTSSSLCNEGVMIEGAHHAQFVPGACCGNSVDRDGLDDQHGPGNKAQTVRGGLGTGGTLGVQGGSTPAS